MHVAPLIPSLLMPGLRRTVEVLPAKIDKMQEVMTSRVEELEEVGGSSSDGRCLGA